MSAYQPYRPPGQIESEDPRPTAAVGPRPAELMWGGLAAIVMSGGMGALILLFTVFGADPGTDRAIGAGFAAWAGAALLLACLCFRGSRTAAILLTIMGAMSELVLLAVAVDAAPEEPGLTVALVGWALGMGASVVFINHPRSRAWLNRS